MKKLNQTIKNIIIVVRSAVPLNSRPSGSASTYLLSTIKIPRAPDSNVTITPRYPATRSGNKLKDTTLEIAILNNFKVENFDEPSTLFGALKLT